MDQRRKGERWQRTWIDDDGETQIEVMSPGFCPGCSLGCLCGKTSEDQVIQELRGACRNLDSQLKKLAKFGNSSASRRSTNVLTQSRKTNRTTLETVVEDDDLDLGSVSDEDEISVVWDNLDRELGAKASSHKKKEVSVRNYSEPKYICKYCKRPYKLQYAYKKHLETKHLPETSRSKFINVTKKKQRQIPQPSFQVTPEPEIVKDVSTDADATTAEQATNSSSSVTSADSGNSSGSSSNPTTEAGSNESLSMDLTACADESFDLSAFLRAEEEATGTEYPESGVKSVPLDPKNRDNCITLDGGTPKIRKSSADGRPGPRMSMSAFMSFASSPIHVLKDQDLLSFMDSPISRCTVSPRTKNDNEPATNDSVSFLDESAATSEKDLPIHSSTMLSAIEPIRPNGSFEDLNLSDVENSLSDLLSLTIKRNVNVRFSTVPCGEEVTSDDDSEDLLQDDPTVLYLRRKSILDTHPYECKVHGCGGRFETSEAISNHLELHKIGGSSKYQCPKCKRSFHDRQNFLKHCELSLVSGCHDTDLVE